MINSEIDKNTLLNSFRHSGGMGISPLPSEGGGFTAMEGAGVWDDLKGFTKRVYRFTSPFLKKAGRELARDVIKDLNERVTKI